MRDISRNVGVVNALSPAVQAAAAQGPAIDVLGFNALAIVVNTGAIVGAGDYGIKLQECDTSGGTYTDVAADQVDSNAPATLVADTAYKLGYRGYKRFVRLALTKVGGTSIAAGAIAVRGDPALAPVA